MRVAKALTTLFVLSAVLALSYFGIAASSRFVDVAEDAWYYDAAAFAAEHGLFDCDGNGNFLSLQNVTRSMFLEALWRFENRPDLSAAWHQFSDVASDRPYYGAVMWAAQSGIVQGIGEGLFAPHLEISREQIAAMLFRFAAHKDAALYAEQGNAQLTPTSLDFTDIADLSDWAVTAMAWCVNEGIIIVGPNGALGPQGTVTRAEAATILKRFLTKQLEQAGQETQVERIGQQPRFTYFGSGIIGNVNGLSLETRFAMPGGLTVDNNGDLIIFDTFNASIRKIANGRSETILGFSVFPDDAGFVRAFYLDGNKEQALFGRPTAGVYASNDDLFITDSVNNAIRLLRGNDVFTFAGGTQGYADGRRGEAQFNHPTAIAIDTDGNLFVTDSHNHTIRMITPDGAVSTIAGIAGQEGFRDGAADEALFCEPSGIAIGSDGAVYIADTGNHVIRKIQDGTVTTVAGIVADIEPGEDYRTGGYIGGADGARIAAQDARFNFPRGIFYNNGTLYIADTGNHAVRALFDGTVTTIAGIGGEPGHAEGVMNRPTGVIYQNGVLHITDSINNRIKTIFIDNTL